jgi:hypothetical protein
MLSSSPTAGTRIVFDRQMLAVESNLPTVHEHLREHFNYMIAKEWDTEVGQLSLNRRDTAYVLEGTGFNSVEIATLGPLLLLLRDEVRLQFMRARPDLLWLHAAAVERDARALIILGASGQGKSTLSTALCELGWRLLSDDIVPVSMASDIAYPFPQTPSRRLPSPNDWDADGLNSAPREKTLFPPELIVRQPAQIGEMVFPVFERGSAASMTRLKKGEAALEMLRHATNFFDHKENAVERSIRLVEGKPAFRLVYSTRREAVQLLSHLRSG